MKVKLLVAACLVTLAMPLAAQAQESPGGVPGGVAHGFNEGNRIAGPLGAVVGGAVGGVVGGVEGVFGVNQRYAQYQPEPARPVVFHHHYRHYRHHHYRHHRHS
jgi:outer membrane lipoprotein SlyB